MKKYQIYAGIGILLLIATYFAPIWWVALKSIQYPKSMYPKGIRIEFKYNGVYNGCKGVSERSELSASQAGANCLIEMNKINHFIGMYPIVQGINNFDEEGNRVAYPIYAAESMTQAEIPGYLKFLDFVLQNSKYFFIIFVLLGLLFMFSRKKVLAWTAIIAGSIPVYYLLLFIYSLYWYGHHMGLHGGGAFSGIKPFMPTVFGEGKVAQFITMSYPNYGFLLAVGALLFFLLAILAKRKDLLNS